MNRRNLVAFAGLLVAAVLVGLALYVGKLKADEPAASKKDPVPESAPQTPAEQIKQLQQRIRSLEDRIAALENRPAPFAVSPHAVPQPLGSEVQIAPSPPGTWPIDGFPPVRILLINDKPADTNSIPAR